jgi:hypothetical protein
LAANPGDAWKLHTSSSRRRFVVSIVAVILMSWSISCDDGYFQPSLRVRHDWSVTSAQRIRKGETPWGG